MVAINTGLRPGELFALTEDDIDFEKNEIKVNKTLLYQKLDGDTQKEFHIDPPKTKSSYRTVPINSFCKEALQKQIILHKIICDNSPYRGKLDFPDLLFTTKYGTPLNSQLYLQAIGRIVDEINLTKDPLDVMEKFSGHTFRHTFATRCFEAGIPPKTVQAYLGHASLQMTMDLYTSVLEKKKVDDMKLLEDTIGLEKTDSSSLTGKSFNLVLKKWRINGVLYKKIGVWNLGKYRKISILRGEKSMTFNNYYVYQSTPFDLYGTPDFSEI